MDWVVFLVLLVSLEVGDVENPDEEVNESGGAHGRYQLTQVFVDEVNRILGRNEFSLEEAHDKNRATAMVLIWHKYWGKKKGTYGDKIAMARQHRLGPNGHLDPRTEEYGRIAEVILKNM